MRAQAIPLALLVTLAPLVAGCLDDPLALQDGDGSATTASGTPAVRAQGLAFPADEAAYNWTGTELSAPREIARTGIDTLACWFADGACLPNVVDCSAAENACERTTFDVSVLDGYWDAHDGALEVAIRWPTDARLHLQLWIEDAQGNVVARAPMAYPYAMGHVAVVPEPAPGTYAAVVAAERGTGAYEAAAQVATYPAEDAARELLPNLVTLPPTDLTLETPDHAGVSYFAFGVPGLDAAMEAAGTQGCRADETIDQGARRCLRFSNAVANVGEGPLEVTMRPEHAPSRQFMQRIHLTDGTFRDVEAGPAEWHAWHGHWHNGAADVFTVHPYDDETGDMGEPIGEGRKTGICFADLGLAALDIPHTQAPTYDGTTCLNPGEGDGGWTMGLTPNWYDLYANVLSDQFVDITGAEDGTYALCSTANPDGALVETSLTDNQACTTFRLEGDTVTVLSPRPYHETRTS